MMEKKRKRVLSVVLPLAGGLLFVGILMAATIFGGAMMNDPTKTYLPASAEEFSPRTLRYRETTEPPTETETEPEPQTTETESTEPVEQPSSDSGIEIIYPVPDFSLSVTTILQLPELPNGCEITALATVLNFYGAGGDKMLLADRYLPCGPLDACSPYEQFVGDPHAQKGGYGCYAPVICNAAQRYLTDRGRSDLAVLNVSGKLFSDLLTFVHEGVPVIVWGTVYMTETDELISSWTYGGTEYSWYRFSHCLVLIGYDASNYWFADPLAGVVCYPRGATERMYEMLGRQAVVIRP